MRKLGAFTGCHLKDDWLLYPDSDWLLFLYVPPDLLAVMVGIYVSVCSSQLLHCVLYSSASGAPGGKAAAVSFLLSLTKSELGTILSQLTSARGVCTLLYLARNATLRFSVTNWIKLSSFCEMVTAAVNIHAEQKSVSGDGAVFPTRLVDKLSQSWCPWVPRPAVGCVWLCLQSWSTLYLIHGSSSCIWWFDSVILIAVVKI